MLGIKIHIVVGNNSNYMEKDKDIRAIFKTLSPFSSSLYLQLQ